MLIAGILNALTSRKTIDTVLKLNARASGFVFHTSEKTLREVETLFAPLTHLLKEAQAHREPVLPRPDAAPADPVQQIRTLAELWERGALTEDEFVAAKKALLARLTD
jgi:hypothetical protein